MNRIDLTTTLNEEGPTTKRKRWEKRQAIRSHRHAVRRAIRMGEDLDDREDLI